ncbi:MAG: general secretion pathway protein GspK [Akkermansiaceae bacterium]|jgi:hypothetical protein|nr:general secretion pathway protein GspK [Akkermansiaceae bacterium]MDP4721257.1 general secretion pathway protein GspK [Akkermansiaceae bacterium]MDP4778719.1 general secretion pathway protein GspK [Akkermansiaceae bacterium]MDP4897870.1 general secretion pathway protein GspK [Akkermansiaceae bacterium]MDP4996917.1 general secretion pathway protein GspK [Akkermansiaceae bacterium]
MKSPRINTPRGLALPMTMIAIAALIILLIGLITVLTLERKTARSFSDAARADLAVESGLAVALGSLTEIAGRDDSIVFRIEDPIEPQVTDTDNERPLGYREQFFSYGAIYENGNWRGLPLFSGGMEETLGARQIEADLLATSLGAYVADVETLSSPTQYDQNIPRARWVEVPANPSDDKDYTMRYAYWIEDLSGRISARTAGELAHDEGESTAELEYATILNPADAEPELPAEYTSAKEKLRSYASIRSIFKNSPASETEGKRLEPNIHFYDTSAINPSNAAKLIPQGYDYSDAGTPAPDLNELVATADVEGIADHIETQIPAFKDRRGGFPASEDYVKTLAASIIDYADTDSNATTGSGYRGVDSYPFINELFDRYEWIASSPGRVSIDVDTYIELWNPSNKAISGTIKFENINKRKIILGGNGTKDFTTASFGPVTATIPANGLRVIPLGKKNYTFSVDLEPAEPLEFNADDSESSFELYWNNVLVDYPRGGVERTYSFLRAGLSQRRWKGNSSPSLDFSIGQYGDPRASIYINDKFYKSDYGGNSNWGGRAIKRDISPSATFRETRLEKWPDRGSNSTVGVAAGTDARVPTETRIIVKSTGQPVTGKDFPSNQPELAPARISNSGAYQSLGELGNIFDPAQWKNVETSAATADPIAGGAITLAIGRPEFGAFDKEDQRASQLLDLFSLEKSVTVESPPININTAPREVLRTLIAGIKLDDDPIATALEIAQDSTDPMIGDIFADQVIAYRASRPLRSVSDLNLIRKDPLTARNHALPENHPYFGNPENYLNEPEIAARTNTSAEYNQADYKEWNDSGREELFRKVMDLVTYRSNLYRIVVAGEALDSNGRAITRTVREYHVAVYPQRDADGVIIPNRAPIVRKLYETTR